MQLPRYSHSSLYVSNDVWLNRILIILKYQRGTINWANLFMIEYTMETISQGQLWHLGLYCYKSSTIDDVR